MNYLPEEINCLLNNIITIDFTQSFDNFKWLVSCRKYDWSCFKACTDNKIDHETIKKLAISNLLSYTSDNKKFMGIKEELIKSFSYVINRYN